jgi:hypothetical protein
MKAEKRTQSVSDLLNFSPLDAAELVETYSYP